MLLHVIYIVWIAFILSAGIPCGLVAWRTFQLRRRGRVFYYFGLVKVALLISTLNGTWALIQLFRTRGLAVLDNLPLSAYRSLTCQTLISITLWLLCLFLFGKINGASHKPKEKE